MCGIAGILSNNRHLVSMERLQTMTDTLRHRGPEGEGFWINEAGNIGLGHRRLSIIELSAAGAQPMHYSHRFTITYNGELYNYTELRAILQKNNWYFSSESDTEVVLAAYACYGKDCLQYFDGMFAFAIWDEQEQTLFCARDRFGEKPFYYFEDGDQFLFASEMKAFWPAGVPKSMDNTMLLNYLSPGFTSNAADASRTFYQGIFKIPPAHFMMVQFSGDGFKYDVLPYWHLDKETVFEIGEHEAVEKFEELLTTSVRRRLRSDVLLGTSLSGGLDSSSITALMNPMISAVNAHTAFSAVFPGFEKNEAVYIKKVVEVFHLNSYTTTPTASDFLNDFEKLCFHQEEPFQSASVYAQYKVYELAKQHGITVLLDGQGADETLAGYPKYYHWFLQELLGKGKVSAFLKERKLTEANGLNIDWGVKNYVATFLPGLAAKQLIKNVVNEQQNHPFLNKEFVQQNIDRYSINKPVVDKLNDVLYFDTMQSGLEDLLRYADRNAMAHSREVRLPFLNHDLVQFVFSLPSHFKIKNGFTKHILRQAMDRKLPEEIVWRKDKVGFEPPQQQWLAHAGFVEIIQESRKKMVTEKILKPSVLNQPVQASGAHEAENLDWRTLCAAQFL